MAWPRLALITFLTGALTLSSNASTKDDRKHLEKLQAEQESLLKEIRDEVQKYRMSPPSAEADRRRVTELESILAEIERRVAVERDAKYLYQGIKQEPYRSYYQSFARRVEAAGTERFPEVDGKRIYGRAHVLVTIGRKGQIESIEVTQSSSSAIADATTQLLKNLTPFAPLPGSAPEKRFVIGTSFNYIHED